MALQELIKFPEQLLKTSADKNVVIRCDVYIEHSGKFSSNFCYAEGELHYPYVTAINRAASRAPVNPGRVNGTARKVYFQYYVVFIKKGTKTSIEVFANSGLQVEKYGLDYSSPQRFKEGPGNFGSTCGLGSKLRVNAVISELGEVKAVDVVGSDTHQAVHNILNLKTAVIPVAILTAVLRLKTACWNKDIFQLLLTAKL